MKKLKFKYTPEDFNNPALRTHLKNIEILALGLEIETDDEGRRILDVTDFTEPHVKSIEKKTGQIMRDFIDLVYTEGYDPTNTGPKKRAYPTAAARAAPAAKRGPATAAASRGTGADHIAAAAEAGTLKKYTVAQLKDVSVQTFLHERLGHFIQII